MEIEIGSAAAKSTFKAMILAVISRPGCLGRDGGKVVTAGQVDDVFTVDCSGNNSIDLTVTNRNIA
jgi:hypothetical protein